MAVPLASAAPPEESRWLQSLATPDIQFTDSLLGLLPGGGNGTDAVEVETFLVNDIYTPLIDALGGGGMMAF